MKTCIKKRLYLAFLIVLSVASIVFLSIKPVAIFAAKQQLKKAFPFSSVRISGFEAGLFFLRFEGIEIKRHSEFSININNAVISPGGNLALKNITVNYGSPVIKVKAEIDLDLDTREKIIRSCLLRAQSMDIYGARVEGLLLDAAQNRKDGRIFVSRISYNKLKVEGISGVARLEGSSLVLKSVEAGVLAGKAAAEGEIKMDEKPVYFLAISLADLDLSEFIKDFGLEEKIELSGMLSGVVHIKGGLNNFEILKGELVSASAGGVLNIKDDEYLKKIASNSGEPYEIIFNSFKDYSYNKGTIDFDLKGQDIYCAVFLDGDSGKRHLNIVLHDLLRKKEEQ